MITELSKYIFIIGVSRSGTSLIRRILNSSSQIAICDETHFLGHLLPFEGKRYQFRKFGDLSKDENVRKLIDYIYSDEFAKGTKYKPMNWQWKWIIENEDKENFVQRILSTDRSEQALFAVIMQIFADGRGKSIKGEKTPVHLRYVPTLMNWYPNAKIIHMLRDPRAIFVSDLRRRRDLPITPPFKQLKQHPFLFKLFIMLQITFVWFESLWRYNRYKKDYPNNYYLLKFEDLILDPKNQIMRLCDFLEVEFQEEMLNQTVISHGFCSGQTGFDTKATLRWTEHIDSWINSWFLFWFRKDLKKYGYVD